MEHAVGIVRVEERWRSDARLRAGCRGHIVFRIRLETVARIDSERVHLINAV